MPNWKLDSDYAFAEKLDRSGWVWEFMRRNQKYRDDFAASAEATQKVSKKGFLLGPGAGEAEELSVKLGLKWGQHGPIADPQLTAVPTYLLDFPCQPDWERIDDFYGRPDQDAPMLQIPEYATLVFDVRRSASAQLKRANAILRDRAAQIEASRSIHSGESEWPFYLRVLDAKGEGADTKQIVETIHYYKIRGTTVTTGYQAQKRMIAHLKQAKKLLANPLALFD